MQTLQGQVQGVHTEQEKALQQAKERLEAELEWMRDARAADQGRIQALRDELGRAQDEVNTLKALKALQALQALQGEGVAPPGEEVKELRAALEHERDRVAQEKAKSEKLRDLLAVEKDENLALQARLANGSTLEGEREEVARMKGEAQRLETLSA